jgi:hypothetical protein
VCLRGGDPISVKEQEIIICGHGSGNPSVKNMYSYLASRYSQKASNGVRKGVVAVRRLKALTDDGRKSYHDSYRTILGRNAYNQNLREYCYVPYKGKYYSDCSSSQMLTLNKVGFKTGGTLNTAGIYQSSLFESVPVKIVAGHIQNPDVLKVGDQLLFAGNDPSRPLQIGHVEGIYEIPNAYPAEVSKWIYANGKWYYRMADGQNAHGWKTINRHWYYFNEQGEMLTGWQFLENAWWYFLDTKGAQYEGALWHQVPNREGAWEIWEL